MRSEQDILGSPHVRLAYVDTLRALACLWVITYHAWILWTHNQTSLRIPLADRILAAGELDVDLFLVLSGFCLALPLLRKQEERSVRIEYGPWMGRRAWRILPPYYLALGLCTIALAVPALRAQMIAPERFVDWPLHIFMLQNTQAETPGSIIGSFWSLALEFQLYALFPLFLFLLRRMGLKGLVIIFVALSLLWGSVCFWKVGASPTFGLMISWYYAVPGRAVEFILGMAAAACISRPRKHQHTVALAIAATLLPVSIWIYTPEALSAMAQMQISPVGIKSVVAGFAFSALLVALRPFDDAIHRFRIVRPVYLFGGISYSAYLLQEPLLRFTVPVAHHFQHIPVMPPSKFLLLLAVWILSVLAPLTVLYYRFAEKPFLRGRPTWLSFR